MHVKSSLPKIFTHREQKYSVSHNFLYSYLFAANQGNHQNFVPSLVPHNLWLIWIKMAQKKLFLKKIKNQNGQLKKQLRQFSIFFAKNSQIGSLVSRINWCKGQQCGSTSNVVRLSNLRSKTGKKHKKCMGIK